jgi:hypothetical protein
VINAFDAMVARNLRSRVLEQIEQRESVLHEGHFKTLEDYRRVAGERKGLRMALELLDTVEKDLANPDPKVRREMA